MRWIIAAVLCAACGAPRPMAGARTAAPPPVPAPERPVIVEAAPAVSPPPLEPPPFEIDAPQSVRWTKVWDTAFSTASGRNGGYVIEQFRNPVLAQAARGDVYAIAVFEQSVSLTLVRLSGEHRVELVELPWIERGAAAAIALDQRTAKVMVLQGTWRLLAVTVDLATAKVTGHTELSVDRSRFSLGNVFRAGDGWVVIGRRQGKHEVVAWSIADRATVLPAPVTVAVTPSEPDETVAGEVAPNGDLLIRTRSFTSNPKATAGEEVFALRRAGRWTQLATPSPEQFSRTAADADSRWLIACWWNCNDKSGVYGLGNTTPVARAARPTPAPSALDTAWLGATRNRMRTIAVGRNVYLVGGEDVPPTGWSHTDGAIYDLAHGTARPFASPSVPGLPDAAWEPRAILPIGDQLCLIGGVAYATTTHRGGEVQGAACLDPVTLAWRWHTSPAPPHSYPAMIGNGCEMVRQLGPSTTLVGCANRTRVDFPAVGGDAGYSGLGAFQWSVWLVDTPP